MEEEKRVLSRERTYGEVIEGDVAPLGLTEMLEQGGFADLSGTGEKEAQETLRRRRASHLVAPVLDK